MKEIAKRADIPYERKPNTVHSFFALKFHDGDEDRKKVESIEKALNEAGIEITLMARDVEKWGNAEIPEGFTLMEDYSFPAMLQCDCNIIEFTEKGVGLGMNAGFCSGKLPIFIIAKTGSDISTTMANVAQEVIFYDKPEDLIEPFKRIVNYLPKVILASGSKIRKQQMIDARIPFEVRASNVDETPNENLTNSNQLADIAMRKAMKVLDDTKDKGLRLIVAADQNIEFHKVMYGKPATKEEAKKNIALMKGSDQVYAITGNAILLADKENILQSINVTDKARLAMDDISDEEIDKYVNEVDVESYCGGISIDKTNFLHLIEGKRSTARGLTLEYAQDMLPNFEEEMAKRRVLKK